MKRFFSVVIIMGIILGLFMPLTANASQYDGIDSSVDVEIDSPRFERICGDSCYATSVAIADELKVFLGVDKFHTIILASSKDFPDALSGTYLAAVKSAPILLVCDSDIECLTGYVCDNLANNGVVYILGGPNAISESVETSLSGFNVKRLAGNNRYLTNLEILKETGSKSKKLLVCAGRNFADSLSAGATGLPILLVNSRNGVATLTDEQKIFLSSLGNVEIYILGGDAAVDSGYDSLLRQYGKVTRVYGSDREETSAKVAEVFFKNPKIFTVAYSRDYPDGLCGSVLAYHMNAPMFLVKERDVDFAKSYAVSNGITEVIVFGCSNVVTDETVKSIFGDFVGRFKIASVGVDVACYFSSSQATVDAKDSAACFTASGHTIIGDHKHQGFSTIKSCEPGTKAIFGSTEYTCIDIIKGHNTGYELTDANYNNIANLYPGALVCYTCNDNWRNVTIVFFAPDDGVKRYSGLDTNNNTNKNESSDDKYEHIHTWSEWTLIFNCEYDNTCICSRTCTVCGECVVQRLLDSEMGIEYIES